jgi:hypothetical protein
VFNVSAFLLGWRVSFLRPAELCVFSVLASDLVERLCFFWADGVGFCSNFCVFFESSFVPCGWSWLTWLTDHLIYSTDCILL